MREKRLILCDCAGSFTPEGAAIAAGTGLTPAFASSPATALCTREASRLAEALGAAEAEGAEAIVGCAQMAEIFEEVAAEAGLPAPATVDIRDRAGWTAPGDAARTGPKQAALMAAALAGAAGTPQMEVESGGLCIVLGAADIALPAAEKLSDTLSVTVLLDEAAELIAPPAGFDVAAGRITRASGAFTRFELRVDGYRALEPAGRGTLGFGPARDGAATGCDIILDLTGARPLFPAPEKRDGYLRADPRDPVAVARAVDAARQLVGTFDKPLHIRFTPALCAHSRAGQTGCTRCLDVCPTGAIIGPSRADQEAVVLDANVCAGCGACAAVCPSGAALSDDPPVEHLFRVMRLMTEAWARAGGHASVGAPRILVHDETHGAEMIRLAARHGDGLPADVIPLETSALAAFGHAEQLVALGLGFATVTVLAGPKSDRETIASEIALAQAVAEGAGVDPSRIDMIEPAEPDALSAALPSPARGPATLEPILASGGRRDGVRLAARALAGGIPEAPLPLPAGAPYGNVAVNTDSCTLCLSCASLCPTGALMDNPDAPELSFREEACIQCGICATACPEEAIALEPRLELSDDALRAQVKKAEAPFACIECAKPFGVKSTVERIVAKLQGKHALFTNSDNVRLIQMCEECRVKVQFQEHKGGPFAGGERPRVRTTDDYLKQ